MNSTDHLSHKQSARIVVLANDWHSGPMSALIEGASSVLSGAGIRFELVHVPGAFDLPGAAAAAFAGGADAVVALGVIIRGETPRFNFLASAVTQGLMDVSTTTTRPIGFGVLIVDNESQIADRIGLPVSQESRGQEAARAAVDALAVRKRLRKLWRSD